MPAIATSRYVIEIASAGSRRNVSRKCGSRPSSAEAGGSRGDSWEWSGAVSSFTARASGRWGYREAFAAAACAGRVRILEHERRIEALALEIDLGAVDEGQPLAVDDHAHALKIEHDVGIARRFRDVDRVAVARAARALDTETHADRPRFREVVLHALL